ncbi:MAG TPA: 2'-5' RNA ligase family protein [Clostridia bacterium]|nr:2'-5' RNA ligase family protein [Clostridia bacterium]
MTLRSAVIVRVRLPRRLERLRVRRDPSAASGIPAHVTILFPFLATSELTPAVRRSLTAIAGALAPFEVRFGRTGRFLDTLWLAPVPAEPFVALTEAVVAAFPGHPPYEGIHDEVIPHCTIALGDAATLDRVERLASRELPFGQTVRALEVIAEDGEGGWRRHWRIRFRGAGVRP